MAIRPDDMLVIAISGALTAILQNLRSKEFMQKRPRWAALWSWPTQQLDRLGDWMYVRMPWPPIWPASDDVPRAIKRKHELHFVRSDENVHVGIG